MPGGGMPPDPPREPCANPDPRRKPYANGCSGYKPACPYVGLRHACPGRTVLEPGQPNRGGFGTSLPRNSSKTGAAGSDGSWGSSKTVLSGHLPTAVGACLDFTMFAGPTPNATLLELSVGLKAPTRRFWNFEARKEFQNRRAGAWRGKGEFQNRFAGRSFASYLL